MTEEWRLAALCAQVDAELFFPETGESAQVRQALRICGRCEPWVRGECLADALQAEGKRGHGKLFGVRGGKTARDREILLGKRKPKADAEPVGGEAA